MGNYMSESGQRQQKKYPDKEKPTGLSIKTDPVNVQV